MILHSKTGMNISSRSGRIPLQVVTILVLGISISFLMSGWRSLGRSFDGMIIDKASSNALMPGYWVYLAPIPEGGVASASVAEMIRSIGQSGRGIRVGISELCHELARPMQRLTKERFSPFIHLEGEPYLDLGLQWVLIGIIGILASVLMYKQSKKSQHTTGDPDEESEDNLMN
ncbi:MAG: hypothetical protein HQM09_10035 [Candidatus Riflebacteria bacterium]|nr:hypothetical protein [Candidatus Riflebacteria bacterium]